MQNDDMQAKFLREFAKIEGIEDEIKKINVGHKNLSKRVDRLEIQGIQEQLNSFHDSLLETQRHVAQFRIDYEVNNIQTFLSQHKHLRTQLVIDASDIKSKIRVSNNPYKLIVKFHDKWIKKLEELKIKFITF